MALAEIILLRTERLTLRLGTALLIGLGGVVVLVDPALGMSGAPVYRPGRRGSADERGAWSGASVLSKRMPMPASKVMSAAAQMLVGRRTALHRRGGRGRGARLSSRQPSRPRPGSRSRTSSSRARSSASPPTHGSFIISRPTKVGTYAYVNPVVAVVSAISSAVKCWTRHGSGTLLVLLSVLVITTRRRENAVELSRRRAVQR